MHFTKMHGCGNDYVYLDGWNALLPADLPALARLVSDRHTGIGGDGLIVVAPSTSAHARMLMFNADGSPAEMCGNGLRCAAKLAYDHGHVRERSMRFETGAGILTVELALSGEQCTGATVMMGRPRLTPAEVPVQHSGPGPLLELTLVIAGQPRRLLAVGMGNPHAVCFVDDIERFKVGEVGALIEHHPSFPRRTNVEFAHRLADEQGLPVLRQRTWERGSGETQACGTGACATVVAAILDHRIAGREAVVRLDGGDLRISWPDDHAEVRLSGPAVTVCDGELAPGFALA
jgi:diaminopimelate epimerase